MPVENNEAKVIAKDVEIQGHMGKVVELPYGNHLTNTDITYTIHSNPLGDPYTDSDADVGWEITTYDDRAVINLYNDDIHARVTHITLIVRGDIIPDTLDVCTCEDDSDNDDDEFGFSAVVDPKCACKIAEDIFRSWIDDEVQ